MDHALHTGSLRCSNPVVVGHYRQVGKRCEITVEIYPQNMDVEAAVRESMRNNCSLGNAVQEALREDGVSRSGQRNP